MFCSLLETASSVLDVAMAYESYQSSAENLKEGKTKPRILEAIIISTK